MSREMTPREALRHVDHLARLVDTASRGAHRLRGEPHLDIAIGVRDGSTAGAVVIDEDEIKQVITEALKARAAEWRQEAADLEARLTLGKP